MSLQSKYKLKGDYSLGFFRGNLTIQFLLHIHYNVVHIDYPWVLTLNE